MVLIFIFLVLKKHATRYCPCEDSLDGTGDKAQTHGITSDHKVEGEEERKGASEEGEMQGDHRDMHDS